MPPVFLQGSLIAQSSVFADLIQHDIAPASRRLDKGVARPPEQVSPVEWPSFGSGIVIRDNNGTWQGCAGEVTNV